MNFYIEELDLTIQINVFKEGNKTIRDGSAIFGNKFFELFPKIDQENQSHKNLLNTVCDLVIAHACSGMKVDSKIYVAGLKTFFENC